MCLLYSKFFYNRVDYNRVILIYYACKHLKLWLAETSQRLDNYSPVTVISSGYFTVDYSDLVSRHRFHKSSLSSLKEKRRVGN